MTTKNCEAWATYEAPASSQSANLCHGGEFEGVEYAPCPSRVKCRAATLENTSTEAKALPTGNTGRRVLASTMRSPANQPQRSSGPPTSLSGTHHPPRNIPANGKRSFFADYARQQAERAGNKAPEQKNRTGFLGASTHTGHGIQQPAHPAQVAHIMSETSPIWMPDRKDGVVSRLIKNIMSGALWALGQQVKDYSTHVDIFGNTARTQLAAANPPTKPAP